MTQKQKFQEAKQLQLRLAAGIGDMTSLRTLVQLGIQVDAPDHEGWTAFVYACANGHFEVAQWLADYANATCNVKTNQHATALYYAASNGHLPIVTWLVEGKGLSFEEMALDGRTPWSAAHAQGFSHVTTFFEEFQKLKRWERRELRDRHDGNQQEVAYVEQFHQKQRSKDLAAARAYSVGARKRSNLESQRRVTRAENLRVEGERKLRMARMNSTIPFLNKPDHMVAAEEAAAAAADDENASAQGSKASKGKRKVKRQTGSRRSRAGSEDSATTASMSTAVAERAALESMSDFDKLVNLKRLLAEREITEEQFSTRKQRVLRAMEKRLEKIDV